jgi:hypothetical protein
MLYLPTKSRFGVNRPSGLRPSKLWLLSAVNWWPSEHLLGWF